MAQVNVTKKQIMNIEDDLELEELMRLNPPPKSINWDLMTDEEIREKLERSQQQILNGECRSFEEVDAEIRAKFGIPRVTQ